MLARCFSKVMFLLLLNLLARVFARKVLIKVNVITCYDGV